jgi:hypothetical protein
MIFASFDLDGTLVNSLDLIYEALASSGYMVDRQDHKEFQLKFLKGCAPPPDFQWELFFYRLMTERHDEVEPIDEHVFEFLKEIYDVGQEPIRVITARTNGVLAHWSVCALLNRLFPDIKFSVDIVGSGSVKHEYMFGTDIMFEDRRKTVRELSEQGNIVFMRRDSYNCLLQGGVKKGEYQWIEDVFPLDLKAGDIILYDNFRQVIDSKVISIIAPSIFS